MFSLRPGSIFDLSIIASDNYISKAADFLKIPNSTLAAYISGARFLSPTTEWDMGFRWGKYIKNFLSNFLLDKKEKEMHTSLKESNISPDWEDDEEIRHYYEIFYENFVTEYNLRQIVEPISWQNSFSCCAAQVLARFENSQPALSKLYVFSKEDAINLLDTLINGPFTEDNYPNMLNLALRYILWRVKTREYYKLEQFNPTPRCIEIRDARPIPLLQQLDYPFFIPDHRFYHGETQLPDTPRLKKAATLDVLMLCRSVEVKADHSKDNYRCSCTSPSNDFIYFSTNPIAISNIYRK